MQHTIERARSESVAISEGGPRSGSALGALPGLVSNDRTNYRRADSPGLGKIAELLANASLLMRHQEKELGFALVRQALSLKSDHPEAIRMLAQIHFQNGHFSQAERAYVQLLKLDYGFSTLVNLADCLYRQGRDSEALERYDQALSTLTGDLVNEAQLFEIYKNMGNIYCRLADFQGAEENYFRALSLRPQSDILLVNLGTLDFQRAETSGALQKFRQAIEINPKNDKAWVGLALVHDQMGDSVLAVANIENAVDLNPKNRTAVHILANWAVREQRLSIAIETLQSYLAGVEQDEEMSLVLIHIFCLNQNFELAKLEIERVLLWNPKNVEVQQLLVEINKR